MKFKPYSFWYLQQLIKDITPPHEVINLSIGEPQFQTPKIIQEAVSKHTEEFRYYPPSEATDYLSDALLGYIKYRYGLELKQSNIVHAFGTREALFNLPQFYLFDKPNPTIAYPNPGYMVYEGAALASKAKIIHMNLDKANHFKPHLSKEEMKEVNVVILNSPNNPTGVALNLEELKVWVKHALEYDFLLICDECYCEIYEKDPPASILEASFEVGNAGLKNIIAINSVSKRSCAPGLRSGYVAGNADFIADYNLYRAYAGFSIPLPLQRGAAAAWNDRKAADEIRQKFASNLKLARECFSEIGVNVEPYSFYLWLEVFDDLDFCKRLYQEESILVLPGTFLGSEGGGKGFIRIALVYESHIMQKALIKLKDFYLKYIQNFKKN
ncbi:succinyldiaminopimelate transaminase [Helicobacter sp. 11S03491-1]|uniref:succinyldiaminopimelate transaminase n=1 Tax=Helicobacter sp. 11S03491-1 TaxID=1476196 RepID=UPI000BC52C86|nr:succinyldiaminopimelate transaminase [Helicobacter sp. 11S03491-1]PAF41823.1 hypothetical protein BKH45_05810 [Helicobacter sp. 11S03491-1]